MSSAGDSGAAVRVLSAGLGDDLAMVPRLPEFLAGVPDHRRAQGRRHSLTSILGLACAAVAAGAKSLVAIAEWAAAAPETALDCLGVRTDPCGGARVVPSETTIRRALAGADAGALDERLAAWLATGTVPAGGRTAAVAVDGKTLRGAVQADGRAVHLLAARTGAGAATAQREGGHKTNEITQAKPLLDPVDLRGAVVTVDALHAQRETARYLAGKGADYIFTAVKDNQPRLFDALDALPWACVPVQHVMTGRAHGRDETRTIQVLPAPAGMFPNAAQAFLIERHVADLHGNPVSAGDAPGRTRPPPPPAGAGARARPAPRHPGVEKKAHLFPGRALAHIGAQRA